MSTARQLKDFTIKIEQKELISQETAIRIRRFIGSIEDSTTIELFMIIGGIMGALFCSAGIFSLIGHNWDEYPKYIRGMFSVAPALVGLYFYYRALFHHPNSRTWIETSSVFLMLMMGASIALVSQTYQLDGDFNKFIKVWALLTLPLFYFARASGIALLYLGLIVVLAINISFTGPFGLPQIGESDNVYWYWLLLLAFAPHYFLVLNKKSASQSIRIVYLSYSFYLSFMLALLFTIDGNYFLWIVTVNIGFYLFGKRFMGENKSTLARPFQWMSQFWVVILLLLISNKDSLRLVFSNDSFVNLFKEEPINPYSEFNLIQPSDDKLFYFILVMFIMAAIYFGYFYLRKHFKDVSMLFIMTPAFVFLAMLLHEYMLAHWMVVMMVNAYILFLGFSAMMVGSENENIGQLIGGFLVVALLLWIRYFDTDWNFIMKGLMFIGIGGLFFLINLMMKGKVERIERNKTRKDAY